MKHSGKEKKIQRMKLIKLIRARPEHTIFREGILGIEFIYNNGFILRLFNNDKTINPPNITPHVNALID